MMNEELLSVRRSFKVYDNSFSDYILNDILLKAVVKFKLNST